MNFQYIGNMIGATRTVVLLLILSVPISSLAHNSVVVIPLAGDNKPLALFAPVAADRPSGSDYSIDPKQFSIK